MKSKEIFKNLTDAMEQLDKGEITPKAANKISKDSQKEIKQLRSKLPAVKKVQKK